MNETTETRTGPKKIWNDALKIVKGGDSAQLMESFTAEMTLVAEGLYEDQNRLRGEVDRMMNQVDQRLQKQESRILELETALEEQQKENDRMVTELRTRLAALEKQEEQRRRERGKKPAKERNLIRDLTILAAVIAAGAIAVILVLKLV